MQQLSGGISKIYSRSLPLSHKTASFRTIMALLPRPYNSTLCNILQYLRKKSGLTCGKPNFLLHFLQQLLGSQAVEICKGNKICRAGVGRSALPLWDGLAAHAYRLGHELLRHLALGAVLFENLAERSCAFGFLTPHRLGAYILSQRLNKQIDEVAYNSPKCSKELWQKSGWSKNNACDLSPFLLPI